MAGKKVSFSVEAKDNASGTINNITGKINNFSKDVKSALKPLDNFGKSLKSLGSMGLGLATIKGGFDAVAGAIKGAGQAILSFEAAFAEADKVVKRIDFAATINKQLGATSDELKSWADELSASLKNSISSDAINAEIANLAFDKTADQIKEIISVATDLSAAMETDLSTAVSQLNQTFSGSVGTLGKYFPELKNISKEALASGQAVEILKGKVSGLSQELTFSSQGSINRFNNSLDNLKEAIGGLVTDFISPLRNSLAALFADLTNRLNEFSARIKREKRIAAGGATLEDAQTELKIWQDKLKQANEKNARLEAYKKSDEINPAYAEDYLTIDKELEEATAKVKHWSEQVAFISKELQFKKVNASDYLSQVPNTNIPSMSTAGTISTPAVEELDEKAKQISKNAEDYAKSIALENELRDIEAQKIMARIKLAKEEEEAERKRIQAIKDSFKDSITGNTGELGSYISAGMEGGGYAVLAKFIGDILAKMSETSGIINQLYNIVSYLINQFIGPLTKLLEPIINPLLTIVQAYGAKLAMMLSILQPIADAVGGIMNVLSGYIYWMHSFSANIIGFIEYWIVELENALFSLIEKISFGNVNLDRKTSQKNLDEITSTFKTLFSADYVDYYNQILKSNYTDLLPASSTGTSASYTAQRDVIINFNIANSFINGDGREIALQIEKELKSAHALGY